MSDTTSHILFGGKEIPIFDAWSKLDQAKVVLQVISQFNQQQRQLATPFTLDTEEKMRKRLGQLEMLLPPPPQKKAEIVAIIRALLQEHTPEETLVRLRTEHSLDCDLNGLVYLAGAADYLRSCASEASLFLKNSISPDQIAALWNESSRPAPGQAFWDRALVEELLKPAT